MRSAANSSSSMRPRRPPVAWARSLVAAFALATSVVVLGMSSPAGRAHIDVHVGSAVPRSLGPSKGRTFYVSTSGSDSSRGTSSAPWRTVQKALNTLTPGQTALVRAGTYSEDLFMSRSGTASKPITLAAYPRARVILRPASTTGDTYSIVVYRAAYFRLHGFVIEGALGNSSANVYIASSSHHIEISANEIRHAHGNGVFTERTTSYLFLLGNRVHDNGWRLPGQQQSHGLYIEGAHDLIANNVIYDHPHGFGLQIWPVNHDTVVVNNTIVASGHSSVLIGAAGPGDVSDVIVRNNILYGDNFGIEFYKSCPETSLADHNLIHAFREAPIMGGCQAG